MSDSFQPPIKGVVLAAGQSRRLGHPKQLLELDGRALIDRVVDRCLASRLDDVIVVVGHEAAAVRHALTGRDVFFVVNDHHEEGQSTSLIAGLNAAGDAGAIIVVLGDQPGIASAAIDRLIEARVNQGATVAMARYGAERGHPVLFGRELFAELRGIAGDQGGREVIRRHHGEIVLVAGGADQVPADIDTLEDYARLVDRHTRSES